MSDLIGRVLKDRYRLTELLGQGGMATVYLAEDQELRREVAVKVLLATHSPGGDSPLADTTVGAASFSRETELLAQFDHKHIIKIFDLGTIDGHPYLVLQYLRGHDLNHRIQSAAAAGPHSGSLLPVQEIVSFVQDIASALDYGHQKGFIHRDVKPHNIILDEQGEVYLSDFGISTRVSSFDNGEWEIDGDIAGTPEYMAPEQFMGSAELTGRADQYALASVVYEAVTGAPPFGALHDLLQCYEAKHRSDPTPLTDTLLPLGARAAVMRALSRDPFKRFETCGQFAEAFAEGVDPKANHVVMLLHGIRTHGEWQDSISRVLEHAGFVVAPVQYGFFDAYKFLLPFKFLRKRPLKHVLSGIKAVRREYPGARISVIAHSFGTYLVSQLLLDQDEIDLRFERIILVGAVVPRDFRWELHSHRVKGVVNDCADSDVLPVLAEVFGWGYGASGRHGFLGALGVMSRHHPGGHSDLLNQETALAYWVPFLQHGQRVFAPPRKGTTPYWIDLLGLSPVRFAAKLILSTALIGVPVCGLYMILMRFVKT